MTSVDRVKKICKERKIPISKLEKDLGYANGYIGQLRKGVFPGDRLKEISDYLSLSIDYILNGEDAGEKYYLNEETAQTAQKIFENKELRLLFDTAKDADPDDLKTVHDMLLALKRKERGDID